MHVGDAPAIADARRPIKAPSDTSPKTSGKPHACRPPPAWGTSASSHRHPANPVSDDLLAPLFQPLTSLKGIGPAQARLMARVTGRDRIIDLLFRLPESYVDRRARPTVAQARPGTVATLALELVRHEQPANPRQPHRLVARDDTGSIDLLYFNRPPPRFAVAGGRYLVSGQVTDFNGRLQINTPDYLVPAERPGQFPWIDPVWPLTEGLRKWQVMRAVAEALPLLPEFPEWHDPALLRREKWLGFAESLRALQAPPGSARRRAVRHPGVARPPCL